jgi:S-methylmethionine-dependent homocysteine/selenocysteine methylase
VGGAAQELFCERRRGVLLLDGATGTELERQGVPTPRPLWSAAALIDCPQVVERVHRAYVEAGADIIVANTFRTNVRTLRAAGYLAQGEALNRLAVGLARKAVCACGSQALVAASVGPVEDCYRPELVPDEAQLEQEHGQMMAWLKAAGPDLVWIETINTVREARAAAQAAWQAGLAFAVSFVAAETGRLLGGEALEEAVEAVESFGPVAIGLNCIPPRGLAEILPRLRALVKCRLAVYAHVNNPVPIPGWSYSQVVDAAEYALWARWWVELGADIVGGCCGTGPEHISAVRAWLALFA